MCSGRAELRTSSVLSLRTKLVFVVAHVCVSSEPPASGPSPGFPIVGGLGSSRRPSPSLPGPAVFLLFQLQWPKHQARNRNSAPSLGPGLLWFLPLLRKAAGHSGPLHLPPALLSFQSLGLLQQVPCLSAGRGAGSSPQGGGTGILGIVGPVGTGTDNPLLHADPPPDPLSAVSLDT